MAVRFNAAPGWPDPPSREWLPPWGWEPSPDWPEPPPGWELYLESRGEQPTSEPTHGFHYGRVMRVRETPVETTQRVWRGYRAALAGDMSLARTAGVVTSLVAVALLCIVGFTAWLSSVTTPSEAILTPSVASDSQTECSPEARAAGWCPAAPSDGASTARNSE